MACERYIDRIQEAVDGTLGSIRRADLEMHIQECDACRALYDNLVRIRDAGAELPALDPPGRVWLQIAGRLRQEGRIREVAPAARPRPSYAAWLAAAAALVIAAGGFVLLLHRSTPPTGAQTASSVSSARGNVADAKSVETVESEVDLAQRKFEDAISNLENVTKANQSTLDPATSRTINKNLDIVDQAIAESRAAVKAEPASAAAQLVNKS